MKIHVSGRNTLAMDILADEFDLTDNPAEADYGIAWKADIPDIPQSRQVLFQTEPPIARMVRQTYMDRDRYLRFVGFPDFDAPFYPYMPAFNFELDTQLGNGIYYAGMKRPDA